MTDQCDALHAAWLPHRAVKLLRSLPPPNPPVETMRCFALLLAVAAAVVHSHAISTRLSPVSSSSKPTLDPLQPPYSWKTFEHTQVSGRWMPR